MSLKRDDELHGAGRARSDTRGRRWRSGIGRCERSVETGFAAGMFGVLSLHTVWKQVSHGAITQQKETYEEAKVILRTIVT